MEKESIKQRLHHLIELRKLIITSIIVLIGGLATLLSSYFFWKVVFVISGVLVLIILFVLNKELAFDIEKNIKKLEE